MSPAAALRGLLAVATLATCAAAAAQDAGPMSRAQVALGFAAVARDIQPTLPKRIDAQTTLVDVSLDLAALTLVYVHEVTGVDRLDAARLGSRLQTRACAAPSTPRTFAAGGALRYVYRAADGRRLADVRVAACP